MNNPESNDVWVAGKAYEPYIGRWSRVVAIHFLDWLAIPPGKSWLDVGCGTGALSEAILQTASPQAVKGVDAAEEFIRFARARIASGLVSFQVGNAAALPAAADLYDAVVSGLALNFFPDPSAALGEMVRAAAPGGVVAAYVWDYADRMQLMRHFWNAAAALDPLAAELDEGRRFPICNPGPLAHLFTTAGLTNVETTFIDIWMTFKDFNDFWSPFLGGQGPAPGYVSSLSAEKRAMLQQRIRAALPFAIDGTISLIGRAWAVRGKIPGELNLSMS